MRKGRGYIVAMIGVLLCSFEITAQSTIFELEDALGFEENVNDVETPIHFLVGLGMLVGSYIGVKKLKK